MLARARQDTIVEMVNRNGSVAVKELSAKFEVSEDSIRKDLALLEKNGLLKRTYGGAMKNRENSHELYVSQRKGKNVEAKKRIAGKAFELISEGEVIFLDISTTNIELAKMIARSNLKITVVTNMIDAMMMFTEPTEAEFIFLGGTMNRGRDGFVGEITCDQLGNFKFDKTFMGVVGVEVEQNRVYTYAVDDALTKAEAMKVGRENYMLLENSKLAKDGNYKYACVDEFEGVIFSDQPDSTVKDQLKNHNVKIYY